MSNERLLRIAERYFKTFGRLPLHMFQKLVAAGFIVEELEDKWIAKYATD